VEAHAARARLVDMTTISLPIPRGHEHIRVWGAATFALLLLVLGLALALSLQGQPLGSTTHFETPSATVSAAQ
jgi:hypothetical protein